jgi:hypothetical protein
MELRSEANPTHPPRVRPAWELGTVSQEVYESRLQEVGRVLDSRWAPSAKYWHLFGLFDGWEWEDMTFFAPATGEPLKAEPESVSPVTPDPKKRKISSITPTKIDAVTATASNGSASSGSSTSKLSPDQLQTIERNRQAALARRKEREVEANAQRELAVFEAMQWLP